MYGGSLQGERWNELPVPVYGCFEPESAHHVRVSTFFRGKLASSDVVSLVSSRSIYHQRLYILFAHYSDGVWSIGGIYCRSFWTPKAHGSVEDCH